MRKSEEELHKDLVSHVAWTRAVTRVESLVLAADGMDHDDPMDERMVAAAMMLKATAILYGLDAYALADWLVQQTREGKALEELLKAIPAGNA